MIDEEPTQLEFDFYGSDYEITQPVRVYNRPATILPPGPPAAPGRINDLWGRFLDAIYTRGI
jgi:hypothetical protein